MNTAPSPNPRIGITDPAWPDGVRTLQPGTTEASGMKAELAPVLVSKEVSQSAQDPNWSAMNKEANRS